MMMRVYVNGIGCIAPGITGPATDSSILTAGTRWEYAPMQKLIANMLPANERRRTTSLIKLAIQVAHLAIKDGSIRTNNLASVFSSSDGDLEIVHRICESLCAQDIAVSPTQFHNSVHNAPAGYWAIAANTHAPSSSISAGDDSFAAGLLESVTQVKSEHRDVLFVCYDYPPPEPLDKKRDIHMPFGLALLLSESASSTTRSSLTIEPVGSHVNSEVISKCQNSTLEALRHANPAARGLPLLEVILRKQSREMSYSYAQNNTLKLYAEP